jgi:predicted ester cyclase
MRPHRGACREYRLPFLKATPDFFGHPGTGDHIEWMAIHIYTIRDGKILEDAIMTDALAILQQLGVAPRA